MLVTCYPDRLGTARERLYENDEYIRKVHIQLCYSHASQSRAMEDYFDTENDAATLAEYINENDNIYKLTISALQPIEVTDVFLILLDELTEARHIRTLAVEIMEDNLEILKLCFDYLPFLTSFKCKHPLPSDAMEHVGKYLGKRADHFAGHTRIRKFKVPMTELGMFALLRGWTHGYLPIYQRHKYSTFPEEFIVTEQSDDVEDLPAFTELGWRMLGQFLLSGNCSVTNLKLDGLSHNDEVAAQMLLDVVHKNHTLTHIDLPITVYFQEISGIDRLLKSLGKSADMNETYKANHTIQWIRLGIDHVFHFNAEIEMLMTWNGAGGHQPYFARCRKMLEYHFGPQLDVSKFAVMTNAMVCQVGSLFDRAVWSGVNEDLVNRNKRHFYYEMMRANILKPRVKVMRVGKRK